MITQKKTIEIPFDANHIFVYNPTDAPLYLRVGATDIPTVSNADFITVPKGYDLFSPYASNTFAAWLNSPTGWNATVFFMEGDADYGDRLWEELYGTRAVGGISLNPLPNPVVVAAFTYTIL